MEAVRPGRFLTTVNITQVLWAATALRLFVADDKILAYPSQTVFAHASDALCLLNGNQGELNVGVHVDSGSKSERLAHILAGRDEQAGSGCRRSSPHASGGRPTRHPGSAARHRERLTRFWLANTPRAHTVELLVTNTDNRQQRLSEQNPHRLSSAVIISQLPSCSIAQMFRRSSRVPCPLSTAPCLRRLMCSQLQANVCASTPLSGMLQAWLVKLAEAVRKCRLTCRP